MSKYEPGTLKEIQSWVSLRIESQDSFRICGNCSRKLTLASENLDTIPSDILSIKNDLSKLTESNVKVSFIQKFPKPPKSTSLNLYKNKYLKPNSLYLYEGFRSICPVTSQPDWAHIYIKSDKKIENTWIYKLLYSYRQQYLHHH